MELTVRVHHEDGSYWAEVVELPGCFVSGDTVDELLEALNEAVPMYLEDAGPVEPPQSIEISDRAMRGGT